MAAPKSKQELLNRINNFMTAFYTGLAGYAILGKDEAIPLVDEPPHDQLIALWKEDAKNRKQSLVEFLKLLLRAALKEPFELVKDYCDLTNQTAKFQNSPLYHFARHIRNAVSHDFRFQFSKADKEQRLPITWREKTIEERLENTELNTGFMGPGDVWELLNDLAYFVVNELD